MCTHTCFYFSLCNLQYITRAKGFFPTTVAPFIHLQTFLSLITNFPPFTAYCNACKRTCFCTVLPLLFPDESTGSPLHFRRHESGTAVAASVLQAWPQAKKPAKPSPDRSGLGSYRAKAKPSGHGFQRRTENDGAVSECPMATSRSCHQRYNSAQPASPPLPMMTPSTKMIMPVPSLTPSPW